MMVNVLGSECVAFLLDKFNYIHAIFLTRRIRTRYILAAFLPRRIRTRVLNAAHGAGGRMIMNDAAHECGGERMLPNTASVCTVNEGGRECCLVAGMLLNSAGCDLFEC